MNTCSLGFIFDTDLKHVLLVHKGSPEWQKGLINGVGGKIELGETPLDCMVRECEEETALKIPSAKWLQFATMNIKGNITNVYATTYKGAMKDARKNHHEEIEWFPYNELPQNVIANIPFFVPMARQQILGHDSVSIEITY